ncbi:hypothetical protein N2152v2_003974 [Parachlorella kessleri]
MHALPIKPSRIFYRREQDKKEEHLAHVSPKSPPAQALRPASPTKKPSVLTARTPSDTLQDDNLLASHPLPVEELEKPVSHRLGASVEAESDLPLAVDLQVAAVGPLQASS